ncbi:polysaccharide biosynthesis/export family protein [Kangiella sediminilitoris]|uniref:Polysaccharide export protein n=1 Tax=Kangiella sediminilitoris TaxID=1144748 RepID=A0A1B3BBK3_9GAMM|nr:SLBB domain-containing protein [Kangiella sediminilitoris]AOE50171.1 Polysaccharide export protein [Kangiella sediminilitoris]
MMKRTLGLVISVTSLFITLDAVAATDLSQAKQLCENATEQQRQMARAAGYDVDSMCASLRQQNSSEKQDPANSTVLPRELSNYPLEQGSKSSEEEEEQDNEELPRVEQKLEKFGYDLFSGAPTTFTPVSNIPVPSNYIVGPGDTVKVQLYGKENNSYELTIERDGSIQFPQLGPINVAGLSYNELKESLSQRISEQYIGVQSNVSLGELRSIQIFVLGESFKPGAYTVSSLSTIMNALYVSGGLTDIASLRNIQLKRNGQLVSKIDLYDLLLKGDTSDDLRLQSGDVIYIPSVKRTASIAGEVVRPAIYELKNEQSVNDIVKLAGGFLPTAYKKDVRVERISNSGQHAALALDLSTPRGQSTKIVSGDKVKVYPAIDREENVVDVIGHVQIPGKLSWRRGMKLTDALQSPDMLRKGANANAVLISREVNTLGEVKVLFADLKAAWKNPASLSNLTLKSGDDIYVLANRYTQAEIDKAMDAEESKTEGSEAEDKMELEEAQMLESFKLSYRNKALKPLLNQLKQQGNHKSKTKIVEVVGAVKFPGDYPLTENMTVTELISVAGGFTDDAYTLSAELTRQNFSDSNLAQTLHMPVDLPQEFLGNVSLELNPYDQLNIKVTPEFREASQVTVQGEVRFPGTYQIRRGETLSTFIKRVGGFTDFAHKEATVFSRKELRENEEKQLRKLQDRLRQDIAAAKLEDANANKASSINSAESLVDVLETSEATGRLVIDIESILEHEQKDLVLKDGDKIIVPEFRQEVTVVGEVQVPTSHLYTPGYDFYDYIERSGGKKDTAENDAIYIVKANGSVVLPNDSLWLTHDNADIQPGDTIVVPLDTDRIDSLELWTSVSQIVYQIALGAAAINSF